MSSVEERKKNRIKKTIKTILENNPITGPSVRIAELLKGKLTKEKEITLESIISDLKLSSGDRGAAEAMPKKDFDESVARTKMIRNIQKNIKPAFRGITAPRQSKGPTGMTQQEMRKRSKGEFDMKKGGKTKSKYSKGGGVRTTKYKI